MFGDPRETPAPQPFALPAWMHGEPIEVEGREAADRPWLGAGEECPHRGRVIQPRAAE